MARRLEPYMSATPQTTREADIRVPRKATAFTYLFDASQDVTAPISKGMSNDLQLHTPLDIRENCFMLAPYMSMPVWLGVESAGTMGVPFIWKGRSHSCQAPKHDDLARA